MSNKKVKCAMAAALAGTMLGGGCGFGSIPWNALFYNAAVATAVEFVLDNDGVFDLFEDGAVTVDE